MTRIFNLRTRTRSQYRSSRSDTGKIKPIRESDEQKMFVKYWHLQHPDILIFADMKGINLNIVQAAAAKAAGSTKYWPDIFIAKTNKDYAGCFIELKRTGTRLRKRNGEWASSHIAGQDSVQQKLRDAGYYAEFAVGFDEAVRQAEEYLSRAL